MSAWVPFLIAVAVAVIAFKLGIEFEKDKHREPHDLQPGDWWDA